VFNGDLVRPLPRQKADWTNLPRRPQFNSMTRIPSMSVAELMRILLDDVAWDGPSLGTDEEDTRLHESHVAA